MDSPKAQVEALVASGWTLERIAVAIGDKLGIEGNPTAWSIRNWLRGDTSPTGVYAEGLRGVFLDSGVSTSDISDTDSP